MARLRGPDGPTVRAPGPDDVDIGRGEDRIDGGGEVGVPVPDEEAAVTLRRELAQLNHDAHLPAPAPSVNNLAIHPEPRLGGAPEPWPPPRKPPSSTGNSRPPIPMCSTTPQLTRMPSWPT
jgi:hypothetical protein